MQDILSSEFINRFFLNNSMLVYIKAFIFFIVLFLVLKTIEKIILTKFKKSAQKTKTDIDDALVSIIGSVRPHFYLIISIWLSVRALEMSGLISSIIDSVVVLFVTYQIIISLGTTLNYIGKKKEDNPTVKSAIGAIIVIGKIIIWSLALLLIFSIFGIDITAMVAGLGIGGIAIALAMQGILSDLFSSLSIYLDRPVDIGDFVEFDDISGNIKKIGIKTTRIQSLSGEEIIVPNQKMVTSLIHNYGRMSKRRVVTNVGVEYSTERKNLILIPNVIKEIVLAIGETEFERCHLKNLGNSAMEFELVYYVNNTEYVKYMDINEKILVSIKSELDNMGVSIAFPSQTIYLQK